MKNNKIIVIALSILFMLMAIIATAYAYFQVNIEGNNNASSILLTTANLGIVYNEGNTLNATNISPGWSASKTFTIKNTSTIPVLYNINWIEVNNNLINKIDLVYEIIGTNSLSETECPSTNGLILSNISIENGITHSYTIILTYKNASNNQASDMAKEFIGKIEITQGS